MFDLIIIGGGPAGAAGAVYAARKQLKTLLVTYEFGGQSIVSEKIENWIGTTEISGPALAENLKKHVFSHRGEYLEIIEGKNVAQIQKEKSGFLVVLDDSSQYQTNSILITSGGGRKKLEIPGGDKFEHKGLTYCASCDGPLFAGADVIVVGGGNAGFETAAQLLAYAKSVSLVHRSNEFKADKVTVQKVLAHPNMKAYKNYDPLEVLGERFVAGMKIKNNVTGEELDIVATGIFVEIGQVPNTNFVKDVVKLDKYNRIPVDPKTQMSETPGIWAAGDVTDGLYHQNNIAAGDAVKAVENIYLYQKTK